MQEMRRHFDQTLLEWKQSPNRKPLVVFGARQVGKTHLLKRFGAEYFDSVAYLDFSRDSRAAALFDGPIDPERLVHRLELTLHQTIDPATTLIILDEIQLCERALTSLKYFCDDAPQYHVAAAGSLLGVKIQREQYSFPVGKVDLRTLHPLDFEEYLWARNEAELADEIRQAYGEADQSFPFHDRGIELAREYTLVGGMPEAISTFLNAGAAGFDALQTTQAKQRELSTAYVADMAKYATANETPRIIAAWNSIPRQLAKENHKFQYKVIATGARSSQFEGPLAWLDAAGVIMRCTHITDAIAPLKTFEEPEAFKIYMTDTGLLAQQYEAMPQDLEPASNKAASFRGGLMENYVLQQLVAQEAKAYYWGTASKTEVEFVSRSRTGDVLPIEVKSGQHVGAKSLEAYRRKYEPPYVVRISARNFGFGNGVRSVPLYAAHLLGKELMPIPDLL